MRQLCETHGHPPPSKAAAPGLWKSPSPYKLDDYCRLQQDSLQAFCCTPLVVFRQGAAAVVAMIKVNDFRVRADRSAYRLRPTCGSPSLPGRTKSSSCTSCTRRSTPLCSDDDQSAGNDLQLVLACGIHKCSRSFMGQWRTGKPQTPHETPERQRHLSSWTIELAPTGRGHEGLHYRWRTWQYCGNGRCLPPV